MSKQVILVTGASSGFGLMTTKALAQAGYTVYASMRATEGRNAPQVAAAAAWAAEQKADLRTVELDVQSDVSADAAVAQVVADTGRLDAVVHNAGTWSSAPPKRSRPISSFSSTTSTCSVPNASTAQRFPTCVTSARACWVTVGTAVSSRPPYRSRRALLTHRAPPSGPGVETVTGQRV